MLKQIKKYRSSILLCLMLAAVLTSCKKEKEEPVFTAQGYWTGNVYFYNAVLSNSSNGTSRFYVGISGNDTAAAQLKLYGSYQSNANSFEAAFDAGYGDTAYLKADNISAQQMKGAYRITNTPGANLPFEFKKQP